MINDEYQKILEKDIYDVYSKYDNLDRDVPKKLSDNFEELKITMEKLNMTIEKFPMVEFKIFDDKVIVDDNVKKIFRNGNDDRLDHLIHMFTDAITYAKKHNQSIPVTKIYIWISDRFPYETSGINNFPIYVFSRPKDMNLPIIPDNTFYCLSLEKKYEKNCYGWNEIKQLIDEKTNNKIKEDIIYFKGTPTTKSKSQIREKLEILSDIYWEVKKHNKLTDSFIKFINDKAKRYKIDHQFIDKWINKIPDVPLKILLDGWSSFEPVYEFAKYKYLINLPGHFPWSNRLKYLFLMKSHVINVNVQTFGYDYTDEKYITFIDFVLTNDDYNEIIVKYYTIRKSDANFDVVGTNKKNDDEFDLFYENIRQTYLRLKSNDTESNDMIDNAYKKIDELTEDRVSQYIYKCIVLNSELGI